MPRIFGFGLWLATAVVSGGVVVAAIEQFQRVLWMFGG